jgi:glucokinase
LAIGVDVGGTKVAAGVVDEAGHILTKLKRSTPAASPLRTEQAIADVVTELLAGHDVAAIGLGAAGFVDGDRATMLFAPNLAWRDEPLKQRVEERLGREVVVENDANASAWAETRFGAARGYRDVMLVAVGTGIGAAIIIGGELYRGRWGIAGEPGHVRVVPDGRLCGCGNRGCWEQYASGNALVAEAREFARRTPVGDAAAPAGRRNPRGHLGAGDHPRGDRRRSCRVALLPDRRQLARPGPGRPGRDPRPGLLRDRGRRVRGG